MDAAALTMMNAISLNLKVEIRVPIKWKLYRTKVSFEVSMACKKNTSDISTFKLSKIKILKLRKINY